MPKLDLAVDIAKTVTKAVEEKKPIDIDAKAGQLTDAHPESNASSEEVAEVLDYESQHAGVETKNTR